MDNNIAKIINGFKQYNPKLYVIAIYNFYKGSYFVIAKHTKDKNAEEDDPFYVYSNGDIRDVSITDSVERMEDFQKIINKKNQIYEIED